MDTSTCREQAGAHLPSSTAVGFPHFCANAQSHFTVGWDNNGSECYTGEMEGLIKYATSVGGVLRVFRLLVFSKVFWGFFFVCVFGWAFLGFWFIFWF